MFKTTDDFKKNDTVEVLDSIMGSHKTTKILEWMDDNPNVKYIYVSPLLTEVEEGGRIHTNLKRVSFETPTNDNGSKSDSFLELLKEGNNVACTHSLYLGMTSEHFNLIAKHGYTVIIDEELDVIESFDKYSISDLEWLYDNGIVGISEVDGMVSWIGDRYLINESHKYYTLLCYCDAKALYTAKRSNSMMVTQLPVRLFECARRVIILTYMFKGNILDSFLKLKGIKSVTFTEVEVVSKSKSNIRNLITLIPPNSKLINYSMSSSWYKNKATSTNISDISKYIRNTCVSLKCEAVDVAWCVPKDRVVKTNRSNKSLIAPKGYTKTSGGEHCYLSAMMRATNLYRHKKVMIHCYDRYPHISVTSYLQDFGVAVDNQVFALSELLQWAWRGCIRDDQPMTLAIGSKRMYNLFKEWLEKDDE